MQQDLSIMEFETLVTTRVLSRLLTDINTKALTESLSINEMALKFCIASNGVLKDFNLADVLQAIHRGERTYIIFRPTGRISCEVCIDGLYSRGKIRQPKAILTSKRGFIRSKTIRDMADYTNRLGKTNHSKGGRYGKRTQS